MSACRRASCKSAPRRGVGNHAFALASLVGPAHDAPRQRLDLEEELALALAPGRVFLPLVAVGQRFRVQLAQPIEHRIGVRIVDRFADLAVHHFLEAEMLGRRRAAADERQKNRDSPYFPENRDCPYFCRSSIAPSMRRAASGAASTFISTAGASGFMSRMRCCASSTGMSSLKTRTMSPEKSCSIAASPRPKLRTKPKK